jgi:hypothetical protein
MPRKLKEEAILLRIPLGPVCRAAIKEKILNGNGGLPVEKVRSMKQATQLFNKIRPVFDALVSENFIYELQHSPIPLVILKTKISVIPDYFLRDYVEFCLGGVFSEQILSIYLEDRSECIKTAKNAESETTSQTA